MQPTPPPPISPQAKHPLKYGPFGLIMQTMGLLLAAICCGVFAFALNDIAYHTGPGNDWGNPENTVMFLAWVIVVPGWLLALFLSLICLPARKGLVIATCALGLVQLGLVALTTRVFDINHKRRAEEDERTIREIVESIQTPTPQSSTAPTGP